MEAKRARSLRCGRTRRAKEGALATIQITCCLDSEPPGLQDEVKYIYVKLYSLRYFVRAHGADWPLLLNPWQALIMSPFQKCYVNRIIRYVTFRNCFYPLSIILWSILRVVVSVAVHFSSFRTIPPDRCTTTCGTITPVPGHLGCFQCLVIENKAIVNIYIQVLEWTKVFIFLRWMHQSPTGGLYDSCMFSILIAKPYF